jgi:hypothetical protein
MIAAVMVGTVLVAPASAQSTVPLGSACPDRVPSAGFADASGTFEREIDCVAWWDVAQGTGSGFEPRRDVTREQMATFVARMVRESGGSFAQPGRSPFSDVRGGTHADNILQLELAGIVQGVTPTEYAPSRPVTRGQMASFLARAWEHRVGQPLPSGSNGFRDVSGTHADNITRIARAGITQGTASGDYEPDAPVTRGQMAAFLARMLAKLVADGHAERPPLPTVALDHEDLRVVASQRCKASHLGGVSWQQRAVRIDGQDFGRALSCGMRQSSAIGWREYDLGRSYTRFQATVGIADDSSVTTERIRFLVIGDGQELARRDLAFGDSSALSVDVTGVLRLRIEVQKLSNSSTLSPGTIAAWGEPRVR